MGGGIVSDTQSVAVSKLVYPMSCIFDLSENFMCDFFSDDDDQTSARVPRRARYFKRCAWLGVTSRTRPAEESRTKKHGQNGGQNQGHDGEKQAQARNACPRHIVCTGAEMYAIVSITDIAE